MNPNEMLLWLSAKGNGTWERYRAAVEELQLSDENETNEEDLEEGVPVSQGLPSHLRMKLNLERLGHVEFFRSDFANGWRVVPPTMACDDAGVTSILCGARTELLLENIDAKAVGLKVRRTPQKECPDCIAIESKDPIVLKQFAERTGVRMQPRAARSLLAAVPPIDNEQLRLYAEMPFGKDWEVKMFDPIRLVWSSISVTTARNSAIGLFRFSVHFKNEYFIKLHGKSFRVPVQVGKFLMLRQSNKRITMFDPKTQVFSVPVTCRPPLLIDRALTLCTGLIPELNDGRLVYRNVDQNKAVATNSLLRQ